MRAIVTLKIGYVDTRKGVGSSEEHEPRCCLGCSDGRNLIVLKASTQKQAFAEMRERLGITGRLTKKKFFAAGGMFLIFEREVIFPKGLYLDRKKG